MMCKDCGQKGCYVEENQEQEVIKEKKQEELKRCGECSKKGERKAVCPTRGKAQQSSTQARDLEGAAKERGSQREVRITFQILSEVWLNIRIEKTDTYEGITIKALLDSRAMGMFMDRKMAVKHGFKLQKLKRPIRVKNVDGTHNSGGAIIYQIEVNVYYKGYVKRMRMDVCDLEKIEVILGMPWLVAHNPEINWETGEVKMTQYLPLCSGVKPKREEKKKRGKRVVTLEEEKIVR